MVLCTSSLATTLTSTVEFRKGTHRFEIAGYSGHKGRGVNEFVSSGIFRVAGCKWRMHFFPDGHAQAAGYAFVSLQLASKKFAAVRASCDLRVLDLSTGVSTPLPVQGYDPRLFKHGGKRFTAACIKQSDLEVFVHGDRLVFECTVTVFLAPRLSKTRHAAPMPLASQCHCHCKR